MPSSPQKPPSAPASAPASASASASASPSAVPPRKSHAGWKLCHRCNETVSSNGRNFIHHMAKCDPVFYAEPLAVFEARKAATAAGAPKAKRRRPSRTTTPLPPNDTALPHYAYPQTSSHTPPPHPPPTPHDYPFTDSPPYAASSPITPHVAAPITRVVTPRVRASSDTFASSLNASASSGDRVALTDAQRSSFVQQLCFLRTYDGAIDAAFDRLERACGGQWGVFNADIFDEMQRCQAAAACAPEEGFPQDGEEGPPEAVVREAGAWVEGDREREAEQGNLMHFANAVADVDRQYWPGEMRAPQASGNESMNLRHVMD